MQKRIKKLPTSCIHAYLIMHHRNPKPIRKIKLFTNLILLANQLIEPIKFPISQRSIPNKFEKSVHRSAVSLFFRR